MTASDILGLVPEFLGRLIRWLVERPNITLEPVGDGVIDEWIPAEEDREEPQLTDVFLSIQVSNDGGDIGIRKAILQLESVGAHIKKEKFLTSITIPRKAAPILRFRFTFGQHFGVKTLAGRLALVDTGNRTYACRVRASCGQQPFGWRNFL